MSTIANNFTLNRQQAILLRFSGDQEKKVSKQTSAVAEASGYESEASSIHTNSSVEQEYNQGQSLLKKLKDEGKISDEEYVRLSGGAERMHVELGRLRNTGRKWQREAITAGGEYEVAQDKLNKIQAELSNAHNEKQQLIEKNKTQEADLKKNNSEKQQLIEKNKTQEVDLKEVEKEIEKWDAQIDKLEKEAKEIRNLLNGVD